MGRHPVLVSLVPRAVDTRYSDRINFFATFVVTKIARHWRAVAPRKSNNIAYFSYGFPMNVTAHLSHPA